MLTYNTHKKDLILPEYGRTIQTMVDHALTIENREERTRCAYAVVSAMKAIVQAQPSSDEDVERRYWDHLAIMSGFQLDIDWPYEVIQLESILVKPQPIPYSGDRYDKFQYGRNLINMIDAVAAMEPGDYRDAMTVLVANQMKKASLSWDDDGYSDARIFADLAAITEGRILVRTDQLTLCEYLDAPKPAKKKKKK